jgi:LysR family glycine cleavage system transcriptional activator
MAAETVALPRKANMRFPPLNALRAFKAADELCVTQGAVSRHIIGLEDWLGTELFTRKRTGVALTAAGETYARGVRRAFEILSDHTQDLVTTRQADIIRLTAPPTFSMFWLLPRLTSFRLLYPQTEIHLSFPPNAFGFTESTDPSLDLAIEFVRRGSPPVDPKFSRLVLVAETTTIVCHPEKVGGAPPPKEFAEIPNYRLLRTALRPNDWVQWMQFAQLPSVVLDNTLELGNSTLVFEAARQGLGLAIAVVPFARADLAQGTLIAPFGVQRDTGNTYSATIPENRSRSKAVKAFLNWLRDQARIESESTDKAAT